MSFYVGDAAGRIDDYSDADKKFAEIREEDEEIEADSANYGLK